MPITARLRKVLESRANGPDGRPHAADRHVYGNECGERVKRVRRAWDATCRRAGVEDLHLHDLRREFGSRLMESGARDHEVKEWLGHANVTTTSRYLKTSGERQTDVESGPYVGARSFHLASKKKVTDEIKRQQGHLVVVTGLVKRSSLDEKGINVGRVAITGGSPVAGTRSMPSPAENVTVMDVSSVRFRASSCTPQ